MGPIPQNAPEDRTASRLRSFLGLLFLLGVLATAAELLLLGHTEDNRQWIPLILLGLSLFSLGSLRAMPGRAGLRSFQGLMVLFVAAGFLGLYLHYQANTEFELEMYPSLTGLKLFWKSVRGATPALAPSVMIELGLLGLASSYRHPKFNREGSTQGDER